MREPKKHLTDTEIDDAVERNLVDDFLNPPSGGIAHDAREPTAEHDRALSVVRHDKSVPDDPIFLGPEALRMKRNSAEGQLRDHIAHLNGFDRWLVGKAIRRGHRRAARDLTDALVIASIETGKLKITMGSQIIRAELLIEFLRTQPRLASEVSRLCHETRVTLSEQLFNLSDEIYALRNSRMAQISDHEKRGFLNKEDADRQREILKQIVAEELIDKWSRYSMVFRNISRHFVRTLTTALEHVQNAGAITSS
jgi:hypothetical protein